MHASWFIGNEKETWSESDEEDGAPKPGEGNLDPAHPQLQFQSHDTAYESGDLGDVSCAYDVESRRPPEQKKRRRKVKHAPAKIVEDVNREEECDDGGRGQGEGRGQTLEGSGLDRSSCKLVDVETGEDLNVTPDFPSEELVKDILREMWRYCHSYHISNSVSSCLLVCLLLFV